MPTVPLPLKAQTLNKALAKIAGYFPSDEFPEKAKLIVMKPGNPIFVYNEETGQVVNLESVLSVSATWGQIGGTISAQEDLESALAALIPLSGSTAITGDLGANGGVNWLISESTGAVSFDGGDFTTDGDGDLSMTGSLTVGSEIRFDSYSGNSDGSGGINNTIYGPSTYAINGADGTAFFRGFQIDNGYFTFDNNAGSSDGNGGFTSDAANWSISGANGAASFDAGSVSTNGYGSLYLSGTLTALNGLQDVFGNSIIVSGTEGGGEFYYGYGNGLLTDNSGQLYWSSYNYSNTPLADNNGYLHSASGTQVIDYNGNIFYPGDNGYLVDNSGGIYYNDGQMLTDNNGLLYPHQFASDPTYVKGAIIFNTTLNKLRVGGATGWETITSV